MAILRLEDNTPEVIAIKYDTPREKTSSIAGRPADWMYTLTDGRMTYLPGKAKIAIERAGVRANQPFEICKVKRGREIEYEIRIMAEGAAATAPPAAAAPICGTTTEHSQHNGANAAPYRQPAAVPALPPVQQQYTGSGEPECAVMMSCFKAALDAVNEAQVYARNKGIGITFSSDNVTSAALSCYINRCKGGR